jgi:lipoprotein-releasing system ATP-binding protein
MTALLEACNITKVIDGEVPTTLIKGISLTVNAGEFVAITGPSGGGKSSLLYLLGLLDTPTSGEVRVNGQQVARLSREDQAMLRLTTLGFVFQFHFLIEELTALENVCLPMRQLNLWPEKQIIAEGQALLARFGLANDMHKRPAQLSGGMRQRVAIARALANHPKLILADEPTGNLDTKNADIVFASLRQIINDTGASVLMVTHDPELAARADRRLTIVDGLLV